MLNADILKRLGTQKARSLATILMPTRNDEESVADYKSNFNTYFPQMYENFALIVRFAKAADVLKVDKPCFYSLFDGNAGYLAISVEQVRNLYHPAQERTAFVRPCPVTPRHGFVESRTIAYSTFVSEMIAIAKETVAADKDGELIVMPTIDAQFSGVAANGIFTLGMGNDGVTSGKDKNTFSLPYVNTFPSSFLKAAGVKNSPYLEVVYGLNVGLKKNGRLMPFPVQLRDGPKIEGSNDKVWSPRKFTVVKVITFTDDLDLVNDWPNILLRETGLLSGCVVWIPSSSLSSHPAVQAIALGLATCVSDTAPKVGDVIPCTVSHSAYARSVRRANARKRGVGDLSSGINVDAFAKGFVAGSSKDADLTANVVNNQALTEYDRYSGPLYVALYLLHNVAAIDFTDKMFAYVFGWACAGTLRCAMVTCVGEARYGDTCGNEVHVRRSAEASRSAVYAEFMKAGLSSTFARRFEKAYRLFSLPWHKICSSGGVKKTRFAHMPNVGGEAWYDCATVTATFANVCQFVAANAGGYAAKSMLVNALNTLVNVAHNGDVMLTKFLPRQLFDSASTFPVVNAIYAAPTFRRVYDKYVATNVKGDAFAYKPFHSFAHIPLTATFDESVEWPVTCDKKEHIFNNAD